MSDCSICGCEFKTCKRCADKEIKELTEQHHLDLDTIANLTPSKTLAKDNVSIRLRYNKAMECLNAIATEGSRPNWAGNLAKKCLADLEGK